MEEPNWKDISVNLMGKEIGSIQQISFDAAIGKDIDIAIGISYERNTFWDDLKALSQRQPLKMSDMIKLQELFNNNCMSIPVKGRIVAGKGALYFKTAKRYPRKLKKKVKQMKLWLNLDSMKFEPAQ